MLRISNLLLSFFMFCITYSFSQEGILKGIVRTYGTEEPVEGVKILVLTEDSTLVTGGLSEEDGSYELRINTTAKHIVKASYFGLKDWYNTLEIQTGKTTEMNIKMLSDAGLLEGVTIEAVAVRVYQDGDTTIYNADQFKVNPDASIEDLIKKMPGITLEDGVYKSRGQEIKKILIDGEEFFGDDAQAALKNLPADIVSKIQTFERESDQARFTGISDGEQAMALNIVTKTGTTNGQFGKIYGGWGPMDKYIGGANLNFFKGKRKISIIALSNNINQQNFSSADILGATSTGSSTSGGGNRQQGGASGGRGNQGGGGGENFQVGQANGISTTHAIGINYSDRWKEKTKVTGSYFFNASINKNEQLTNREYFVSQTAGQTYEELFNGKTNNQNHRANFRFDITLDSMNSLLITPNISYQFNNNRRLTDGLTLDGAGLDLNSLTNATRNKQHGLTASNGLLWRHKFAKARRTFSTNLNLSYNNRLGDNSQNSIRNFYDNGLDSMSTIDQLANNKTLGYGGNIRFTYTEPLSEFWTAEFYYAPSYSASDADKRTNNFNNFEQVYNLLDTTLSNVFLNHTIDNLVGTTFRWAKTKHNFQIGIGYQNSLLLNNQDFPVDQKNTLNFNSFLPSILYRLKINNTSSLSVNYRSRTRNPQISQLQNVIDNSNPLSLSSGNPNLKQQVTHSLNVRYNATNIKTGSSFFAMLSGEVYQNQITNASYIALEDTVINDYVRLARGSQFRLPVNINGGWNTRAYVSYGIPLKFMKSNFNINGGAGYTLSPALINDIRNNSRTTNANIGATLSSNISEKIDFALSYTFSFNNVQNDQQSKANNQYFIQNVTANVNYMPWSRLVLNTNFSGRFYKGLAQSFNQSILLWNAAIGYKVLKNKMLELRISAYDILNNNSSIVRNTTDIYIEDVRSMVLNRYFMFTATYTLKNFGQASSTAKQPAGTAAPEKPKGERPTTGERP